MEPDSLRTLSLVALDAAQHRVASAAASRAGWRAQRDAEEPAALLIGLWDEEQARLVRAARARSPALPILVCGPATASVDAIRAGASDFLALPLTADRLIAALQAAGDRRRRSGELRPLAEKIVKPLALDEIIGSTPAFRAALAIAAKAARSRVPVLIEGERGTGKETLARAIHSSGPRALRPIVSLDCGTLSPAHLEAALFGYEPGAFPGAFDRSVGKFEEADGGTLFIDNIELLSAELQAKLLHVIETGEAARLGGRGFKAVDVRILAAAGARLSEQAAAGHFREDLLSRLALVSIALPPLRERRADIPALARHFLGRFAEQPGLPHLGITEGAVALLTQFGWSGNVRELQTALFRAALHCQGHALTAEDFPQIALEIAHGKRSDDYHARAVEGARPLPGSNGSGVTLYLPDGNLRPLEDIEADVIRLAIGHYHGRMTEVARRLGIGRSTLYRKLAELGISDAA
ncbi:MAG TPA: sigma-54 dependent transcriptional regulator [Allosphingosinicella sp.]|uniref:sigma-54-dependent transcriptional regulator n=1 Tax=Allosphingosinicella sp. TaxID=2823234 RepID=UPI002ED8C65A